jgi:hypothetical protein
LRRGNENSTYATANASKKGGNDVDIGGGMSLKMVGLEIVERKKTKGT